MHKYGAKTTKIPVFTYTEERVSYLFVNLLRKETLNKLDCPKVSTQNDCFELETYNINPDKDKTPDKQQSLISKKRHVLQTHPMSMET